MGLETVSLSEKPEYFLTFKSLYGGFWMANVLFEVKVRDLESEPSDECIAIRFVSKNELPERSFTNIAQLASVFDPKRHLLQ